MMWRHKKIVRHFSDWTWCDLKHQGKCCHLYVLHIALNTTEADGFVALVLEVLGQKSEHCRNKLSSKRCLREKLRTQVGRVESTGWTHCCDICLWNVQYKYTFAYFHFTDDGSVAFSVKKAQAWKWNGAITENLCCLLNHMPLYINLLF